MSSNFWLGHLEKFNEISLQFQEKLYTLLDSKHFLKDFIEHLVVFFKFINKTLQQLTEIISYQPVDNYI